MNLLELFAPIRTFVFDVDGVLTDGSLLLDTEGNTNRSMHVKDGYALQLAAKHGYNVWVITAGKLEAVKLTLSSFGIQEIHIGIESKKEFLLEITNSSNTPFESVLYMGYDVPDYAAMQLCGLPCCPADAVPEIKQVAKYTSPYTGGKGCVRDVIEKVLKLNNHWHLPA